MAKFSFSRAISSASQRVSSAVRSAVAPVMQAVTRAATTVASRAGPSAVTTTARGRTTQQAGAATIGARAPTGAPTSITGAISRAVSAVTSGARQAASNIASNVRAVARGTTAQRGSAAAAIQRAVSAVRGGVRQFTQDVGARARSTQVGGTNLQTQFTQPTRTQSVSPNLPNYAPPGVRTFGSSTSIQPGTSIPTRTPTQETTVTPQLSKQFTDPNIQPKVAAPISEKITPEFSVQEPSPEPTFEPVDQTVVQTAQTLANQGLTPDQIAQNLNQQTGGEFGAQDIQGFLEGGQLAGAIPTEGYIVQPGDTLSSIARRTGVAVGDISGYRSGNANLIYPGENLTINRGGAGQKNVSPASAPPASTLPEETALTTNETDYITYLQEKTYEDIYKTLTEQLGLDDVKDNINDINDKLQKLQDDRAEEEAHINNNPWVGEAARIRKIQSLGGKYDQKEANLREAIKNSQDVYDDARQEAQFAAKMYIDQQNENREFYYKVKQDAEEMKLKREDATPDIQEYKFAVSQGFGGSFMDYQRQAANLKAEAAGDGQTGIPSISQVDVTGDPFLQTLLQSSGGKRLTDTSVQKLDKAFGVLDQLGVLQNNIQNTKTGPITGLFRGKNPWDTNAQTIKAQLNAIVPNLARGVFGEVGVLTDNDIKQYSKTLPNLTSTEDIRNAILGITVDMIGRSLKRTLQVNAANKADVSGYAELYNDMIKTRDSIFSTIGQVSTQPKEKRGIGGFVKDFFSELFTKGY